MVPNATMPSPGARSFEEERIARRAVIRHGVLMEHGKPGGQICLRTRTVDKDVARVGRIDGEPYWVIERATIDAAGVREPLERDIQLRRATQTGVNVKALAAALGGVSVDRGRTTHNAHIIGSKYWLDHEGSARCSLAEPTMTDSDADRFSLGLIANGAAKAPSLMNAHHRHLLQAMA